MSNNYKGLAPGYYERGGFYYPMVYGPGPSVPRVNVGPNPSIPPTLIGPGNRPCDPRKLEKEVRGQLKEFVETLKSSKKSKK